VPMCLCLFKRRKRSFIIIIILIIMWTRASKTSEYKMSELRPNPLFGQQ
jgi:hypothetical protein